MNAPAVFTPPHSVEAEQSLLGALLLDGRAWDRIGDMVDDGDFYRDDHRRIFRHLRRLAEAGQSTDVVSVADAIERANEVDQTGGIAYLGDIANAVVSAANIRRHAGIIKERAALRRLMALGADLQALCAAPGVRVVPDIIRDVESRLAGEFDGLTGEPDSLGSVLQDALQYIDSRSDAGGLQIGIEGLDDLTGGLEPGQLVVVAARPSVGKTAFACNLVDRVIASGKGVLFQTLEMQRREIGMRILAARSSVPVHAMRAGTKSQDAWDRMTKAMPAANGQRLWIDDKPGISPGYIRARARRLQRLQGLDLVVIDYLQLMRGRGDNRVQEIGSISRDLKAIAKELGIPIIVLAQLNRAVESRPDKRPLMSDLRDSGEIEQDADIVVMLHREALYNDSPEWTNFAELIVRKNRNGPLGDVPLSYNGQLMTFSPWIGAIPRSGAATGRQTGRGFR